MRKAPSAAELQRVVDAWNRLWPVGTVVDLRMDSGEVRRTKTRSAAQVLSGHTAVIWLEGVSGCYALSCAYPVQGAV